MGNLRLTLATAERIVFVVAALALSAYIVGHTYASSSGLQSRAREGPLDPGQAAPTVKGLSYEEALATTLLFIRSSCRFCTESMPFYRQMSTARLAGRTRVVAISLESQEELGAYLAEHTLSVDAIVQASFDDFSVSGTPTVIVVGQNGRVLRSWQGLMAPDQEFALLSLARDAHEPSKLGEWWYRAKRYLGRI